MVQLQVIGTSPKNPMEVPPGLLAIVAPVTDG